MLEELKKDLCDDTKFRVRRSPSIKREFYEYVSKQMAKCGISASPDGDFETTTNMIFGNVNADVYLMAHYDTPKNNTLLRPIAAFSGSTSYFINFLFCAVILAILGFLLLYFIGNTALIILSAVIAVYILSNFIFINKNNYSNNTSGCMALIYIAKLLHDKYPKLLDNICFIFTDKKESGSKGAFKFERALARQIGKKTFSNKVLINFDCIGGADKRMCIFTNQKKSGFNLANELKNCSDKNIEVHKKLLFSADYSSFLKMQAVTVMSCSKSIIPLFMYVKNIRTRRDKIINLNMISDYCEMTVNYLVKKSG